MISPTIGRVVWFWPKQEEDQQPFTASVAFVHSDTMINVGGFNHNGEPFALCSVRMIQDDSEIPNGPHCRWMPYQKGQAAKTEALEQKLAK